jgi:two-component system, OmpR family, sensor histidine kinase VicK
MSFFWKKQTTEAPQAEAMAGVIVQTIADGVCLCDPTGNIVMFNPAAELITGWKSSEAVGLNYQSVFQLVDEKGGPVDLSVNPFALSSENEVIKYNDGFLKTRSDRSVNLALTVSRLVDGKLVAVFRDTTEEKNAEKQRAEFISTASHEMRTPVAAIEGYLSLAMNDKVCKMDEKAKDFVFKAHSSTQHLGKLFQDLLTASKSEDGRLTSHPIAVDVSSMLTQLVSDNRFAAEKKGISVDFALGAKSEVVDASRGGQKVLTPLYFVHADPERLREVITNLFDNAVKYSESGKITIGLAADAKTVQIRVQDTGFGIPVDDLPHLFQKFYRVDSSATRTIGGTGLGLFICKKIVELYNGRIWAESVLGKGSTFFINLPRLNQAQVDQINAAGANDLPQISNLASAV